MGFSVVGLGLLPALGLSVSAAYVCAGFLGLMSGIGAGFYGTLVTTAVLRLAPAGQIGRVMSALSFASLSAVPLTYALTGLITDVTAAQVPFFIGGSLVLLAAAIAFANPQLRHLRMDATDSAEQSSDRDHQRPGEEIAAAGSMFMSLRAPVPLRAREESCHEPGIIGVIIGVLVIIILVIVILQPHLTADPRAGGAQALRRPWVAFLPQACTSAPRSLTLCFAAFGVLRCQALVGGREILTAQAGPVQKLEEFSYVRQQSRGRARPPGLLSCDVERC